jgi:hypothetical protein
VNEKLSQLSQCSCCSATLCAAVKDRVHAMREARARAAEKRAKDKRDAEAAVSVVAVNPADSVMITGPYKFLGNYKDEPARAIPNLFGKVKSVDEAVRLAQANNWELFGLQFYGELWFGDDLAQATKYGLWSVNSSPHERGEAWMNRVYVRYGYATSLHCIHAAALHCFRSSSLTIFHLRY